MDVVSIGGFDWYLLKEIGESTMLFAKEIIYKGYFDTKENIYETSKLNAFLSTSFINLMQKNGFDTNKLVNGVWPLSIGQYNIYVKDKLPNIGQSWLLKSPGDEKNTVYAVDENGETYCAQVNAKLGIRPCFFLDTKYLHTTFPVVSKNGEVANTAPVATSDIQKKDVNENSGDVVVVSDKKDNDFNNNEKHDVPERKTGQKAESGIAEQVRAAREARTPVVSGADGFIDDESIEIDLDEGNDTSSPLPNTASPSKKKRKRHHKKKNSSVNADVAINNNNKNITDKEEKKETLVDEKEKETPVEENFNNVEVPKSMSEKTDEQIIEAMNNETIEDFFGDDIVEGEPVSAGVDSKKAETQEGMKSEERDKPEVKEENSDIWDTSDIALGHEDVPLGEEKIKAVDIAPEKINNKNIKIVYVENAVETSAVVPYDNKKSVSTLVGVGKGGAVVKETKKSVPTVFGGTPTKPPVTVTNRRENETYYKSAEGMRKGQNSILSKLGIKNKGPEETTEERDNQVNDTLACYVRGSKNDSIKMVREPSSPKDNIENATNEQLKELIIKRNKQIAALKISLIETNAESEALMEKVDKLSREKMGYEAKVQDAEDIKRTFEAKNDSISNLMREKEEIKTMYIDAEASARDKAKIIGELKKEQAELLAKINGLSNKAPEVPDESLQKIIDGLKEELARAEKASLFDANKISNLSERLNKSEATVKEQEKNMHRLVVDKDGVKAECEKMRGELAKARSEVASVTKKYEEAVAAAEKVRKECDGVKSELSLIRSDKERLLKEADAREREVKDIDAELNSIKEKEKDSVDRVAALESKNDELKEKIGNLSAENITLKEKMKRDDGEYERQRNDNDELREKCSRLQNTLGETGSIIEKLRNEITKLESDKNSKEKEYTNISQQLAFLRSDVVEKQTAFSELKENLEKTKFEGEAYKKETVAKAEIISGLQRKISALEKEIKEKDTEIDNVKTQMDEKFKELESFKKFILGNSQNS